MVFLRLLGRTLTEPAPFIREFFSGEYQQVIDRYKAALARALPEVPNEEIVWRLQFMLGAMSYAIAGTDVLRVLGGGALANDNSGDFALRLRDRLMPFLLAGLRAPLPEMSSRKTAGTSNSKKTGARAGA